MKHYIICTVYFTINNLNLRAGAPTPFLADSFTFSATKQVFPIKNPIQMEFAKDHKAPIKHPKDKAY